VNPVIESNQIFDAELRINICNFDGSPRWVTMKGVVNRCIAVPVRTKRAAKLGPITYEPPMKKAYSYTFETVQEIGEVMVE